jgi:hypothetical protein
MEVGTRIILIDGLNLGVYYYTTDILKQLLMRRDMYDLYT